MFSRPSLMTRVTVAKLVGFAIGVVGFFMAPAYGVDDWKLRVGILFWYTAIGAFIGMAGVFTWHPILRIPMPWWIMGPLIGAWMNFLLILFAWDTIVALMASLPDDVFFGFTSPWWGVAEGAVIGLFLGGIATLFGGEGPATVHAIERT